MISEHLTLIFYRFFNFGANKEKIITWNDEVLELKKPRHVNDEAFLFIEFFLFFFTEPFGIFVCNF